MGILDKIEALLHSAGATVRHRSPFSELPVPEARLEVTEDFKERWLNPALWNPPNLSPLDFFEQARPLVGAADSDVIATLLSMFDWRPRTEGAYLVAATDQVGLVPIVGNLLLRSDVCFAGSAYCDVLAHFADDQCRGFLRQYLDYYLTRPDLFFDQSSALDALAVIDAKTGSCDLGLYEESWNQFVANKPHWKPFEQFAGGTPGLRKTLSVLERLADLSR